MNITKDSVVTIDYEVKNAEGDLIDSSKGREPLPYLHGFQNIVPGLEEALEGKAVGDVVDVEVAPEKAYGEYNDQLLHQVEKSSFQDVDDIQIGMQFQAQTEKGMEIFTVVKIEGENVIVDGNHPLAGITLKFHVEVKEVRAATQDELQQGYPTQNN